MDRDSWSRAGGLWAAQLTQKAAILVFSFLVGRTHGSEGVGVMASVLALAWMVGTVAGMGLPDRSVFRGAEEARDVHNRRLYGSFLVMVLLSHGPMVGVAGWMGGIDDPSLVSFARGLVVGAGLHCASAVGLGWLRGAGRPEAEIGSMFVSALVLIATPWLGGSLGAAWAISGAIMLLGSLLGNRQSGLHPSWPALPASVVREGLPFLVYGLGAWWMGNMDVVLARWAHHPDDVGSLQVGTMTVRGLALVPWVAATLMLKPLGQQWDSGSSPQPIRWVVRAAGVGALVAGTAWVVMPFLAIGHHVPIGSIERTTIASMLIAPVLYAFVFLVPVAAHWHLGRTLKALGIGFMVSIAVGLSAFSVVDVASKIVVAGTGQFVALIWLMQVFRSGRAQRTKMNRDA